jgi:hypothetical protein
MTGADRRAVKRLPRDGGQEGSDLPHGGRHFVHHLIALGC